MPWGELTEEPTLIVVVSVEECEPSSTRGSGEFEELNNNEWIEEIVVS